MVQPVQERVLGAQHCSYRVGGPLDEVYIPKTLAEAQEVLASVVSFKKQLTVLGGGANTIIASQGIRGVTFLGKRLMFDEQVDNNRFLIGAGMPLARVCTLAQSHQLTGAEFMIGVPGTLGGAVTMNAGALGQETAAVVEHVLVFNLNTGETEQWSRQQLNYTYRHSDIDPTAMVVLAAQLCFQPGEAQAIAALVDKNLTFRQTHHPKEPNGGSVFKNPSPEYPIGKMVDEAGAKGWREGDAMVSQKHANFIVNMGQATSTDILKLMWRLKQMIKTQYGFDVSPENRFVGDATDEEKQLWEALTGHVDPSS